MRGLFGYHFAWNVAVGVAGSFFALHMLRNLKMGFALVALHGAATAAVRMLAAPLWGALIDRLGARPVLAACSFGIAGIPFMWLLPTEARLWPLAIDALLAGLFWSGHALAVFALPLAVTRRRERPFYVAAFAAVGGRRLHRRHRPGGTLASWLPDRVSLPGLEIHNLQVLFVMSGLLRLAAAFLSVRIHEPDARGVGDLWSAITGQLVPRPARRGRAARRRRRRARPATPPAATRSQPSPTDGRRTRSQGARTGDGAEHRRCRPRRPAASGTKMKGPCPRSTAPAGPIRAARGRKLSCRGWHQEAALRMLMNNLDPQVAEQPQQLIVYGGAGKAARNWDSYRAIVKTLKRLENDETLLIQSGKPVGVFRTHDEAPRVLIANAHLVPALGDLGRVPPAGGAGADHVRPDDGRVVDLHRHPGDPAGDLRDLRRARRASTSAAPWPGGCWSRAGWAAWAARSRWPPP